MLQPSAVVASNPLVIELTNSSDYPWACPYPELLCTGLLPPPLRTSFQCTDLSAIAPY